MAGTSLTALEASDRISELIYKATGILSVIGRAGEGDEILPTHALSGACWAVRDMLAEVDALATGKGA